MFIGDFFYLETDVINLYFDDFMLKSTELNKLRLKRFLTKKCKNSVNLTCIFSEFIETNAINTSLFRLTLFAVFAYIRFLFSPLSSICQGPDNQSVLEESFV